MGFVLAVSLSLATGIRAEDLKEVVVFESGKEGYSSFRIPALIVSKKGTVLAFCEGRSVRGDTGDIDMVLKRSVDGGNTWGPLQVVWDDEKNTCGNCCPVVDEATGVIHLLMSWNLGSDHEGSIKNGTSGQPRKVYVSRSNDEGATWSTPEDLSETCRDPDWGWYATGPGNAIQLKRGKHKGRLVCPANHSNKAYEDHKYGAHVIYSDDGGKTWKRSEPIRPGCNESQVVELADGALMMNMRCYSPRGIRAISTSSDGGATWSEVTGNEQLPDPTCQASFLRYTIEADGGKNRLLFSNPPQKRGRNKLAVKVSYDEGKTWPVARQIYEGGTAYSSLAIMPDKTIGLFYEKDFKTITFANFTLEWLTEGKDMLEK
jgi:sialidase-1